MKKKSKQKLKKKKLPEINLLYEAICLFTIHNTKMIKLAKETVNKEVY